MKTIDFYKAKHIAEKWHGGQRSALYSFVSTGELFEAKKADYFREVDAELNQSNKYLVKNVEDLQKLRSFFVKYFKLNTTRALSGYTDEQLKKELSARGYCTSSLWSVDDVMTAVDNINEEDGTEYTFTEQEAHEVLNRVVGDEADHSTLNEIIEVEVRAAIKER